MIILCSTSMSIKDVSNDECNKLSINNKMDVSVENSSVHSLDMRSKEQLAFEYSDVNANVLTSFVYVSCLLCHQRLGHPSSQTLPQVLQTGLPCGDNIGKSQLRTTCKMGNSHKLPFSPAKGVYTASFNCFMLTFGDLPRSGQMVPSIT